MPGITKHSVGFLRIITKGLK